jgi:hypothetical protein
MTTFGLANAIYWAIGMSGIITGAAAIIKYGLEYAGHKRKRNGQSDPNESSPEQGRQPHRRFTLRHQSICGHS